jgi:hypothetical protein
VRSFVNWQRSLKEHKIQLYLVAFLMMVIPPVPMYFAIGYGSAPFVWCLLLVIILANLLVLIIP